MSLDSRRKPTDEVPGQPEAPARVDAAQPPDPRKDYVEKQVLQSMHFYQCSGFIWRTVYYVLGIASVIGSGLPAAKEIWSNDPTLQAWGKVGAFATPMLVALTAFLGARRYSDDWFQAWRALKKAWCEYQLRRITVEVLLDTWFKVDEGGNQPKTTGHDANPQSTGMTDPATGRPAPVADMRAEFERLTRQVPRDSEKERAFIESKIEMIRDDPRLSETEKERTIEELRTCLN